MTHHTTQILAAGFGAILAGGSLLSAQTDTIVPPLCRYTDGGGNTASRVFSDSAFRSQHVILGSFLTAQGVSDIRGIAFRPDSGTQSIGAPTGGTFTDVIVKMSFTNFDPISLSTTFATNIAGQPQFVVYDCTASGSDPDVVVPVHPTSNDTGVGPWFDLNFSGALSIFPFAALAGVVDPVLNPGGYSNILVDITSTVAPGTGFIGIDAHQPGGKHRSIGVSGPVGCPDQFQRYSLNVSGTSINGRPGGNRGGMVPGDGYTMFANGAPCYAGAICTMFLQIDLPVYPALPSPIDLGIAGMPGQNLYMIPTPGLELPGTFVSSPISGPRASWNINLPTGDPGMENWRILAQVATIDPMLPASSTMLNVAWSNAVEMYLGLTGGMTTHPTGQVATTNLASATGSVTGDFTSARSYGAVLKIIH